MKPQAQKDRNRVVVYVEGGAVQAVYAPADVEVAVLDFDVLKLEGFSRAEMENMLVITRGTLPQRY